MNRKQWQAIAEARKLLELGDRATRDEMKRAFYRLSKDYHPDTADEADVYDAEDWWMDRFGQDPLWSRCNE